MRFRTDYAGAGQVARIRAANYFINIARNLETSGNQERALIYLQLRADHYISKGQLKDFKIARALLDEAGEMFVRVNRPELYRIGLCFAKQNLAVKRPADSKRIVSQILEFIEHSSDPEERDGIRCGLAMMYLDTDQLEAAVRIAGEAEQERGKGTVRKTFIDVFADEARWYEKKGEAAKGLHILLIRIDMLLSDKQDWLEVVKPLLDEGKRIFEAAADPEIYFRGLKLAAGYCSIKRDEEAESVFARIREMIDRCDDQVERDEIRHDLSMAYLNIGREEDAVKTAKGIESGENKCFTFKMVISHLIVYMQARLAREALLDYLEAARTIEGCQLCAGKYDYTERASKMMFAAQQFDKIGEVEEAKKIRQEIRSLAGSFMATLDED